jgi:hypothetical protein
MAVNNTELEQRPPVRRAPLRDGADLNRQRNNGPRYLSRGGASAAIGETDVILYRSYAIVERLRQAVAARGTDL